ncbi:mannan endo-1 [Hanseniaspora vineae]
MIPSKVPFLALFTALSITSLYTKLAHALSLDPTSKNSICSDTALIEKGMLDYYEGTRYGGTVGYFQAPYYWWEAGEGFGAMIENWFVCDNDTFTTLLQEALIHQASSSFDYMPENQTMVEGNDDQGVWGLTLMTAAERNFTRAANGTLGVKNIPDWVDMAQAVYNTMYSRWDTSSCGGGLRWQIFTWNNGYNYKNTVSNGCLFQMAARLGRYFSNDTYLDVAEQVWDWLVDVGFVNLSDDSKIWDGATIDDNCTSAVTKIEWSYNYGIILGGAAYMYNATNGSSVWETRVTQLLDGAVSAFFNEDGIMYEQQCQASKSCNNDQRSFKTLFSANMGYVSVMAPFTASTVDPLIISSATAAAGSCDGGYDGVTCGMNWFNATNDGYYGLGEQMCALSVIQTLLVHDVAAPYQLSTNDYMAQGNSEAGLSTTSSNNEASLLNAKLDISHGDRVGASIITAVILLILITGSISMLI